MEQEEVKKEEKHEEKTETREIKPKRNWNEWYNKNYKLLLWISVFFSLACIAYLVVFTVQTGDIMNKDITLTGGTSLTIYTDKIIDLKDLETKLSSELNSPVVTRTLQETYTGKQRAIVIETKADATAVELAAEKFLDMTLDEKNSSIEMTGTVLSQSFYQELIKAMGLAFLFMAIVVFIIFRKPIPSLAVIQAAITDIAFALVMSNLIGLRISTAGIAALLMLIGYSVDTDILLTTRVLKRKEESVNTRIRKSFKTGITMTIAAIVVVMIAYFTIESSLLREMFLIISFGLAADTISTWLGNAGMVKWYVERKNKKGEQK